jgi:hypothetical protein
MCTRKRQHRARGPVSTKRWPPHLRQVWTERALFGANEGYYVVPPGRPPMSLRNWLLSVNADNTAVAVLGHYSHKWRIEWNLGMSIGGDWAASNVRTILRATRSVALFFRASSTFHATGRPGQTAGPTEIRRKRDMAAGRGAVCRGRGPAVIGGACWVGCAGSQCSVGEVPDDVDRYLEVPEGVSHMRDLGVSCVRLMGIWGV